MPPSNQPRTRTRLEQHQQRMHLQIPDNGDFARDPNTGNEQIVIPFGARGFDVAVLTVGWVAADLLLWLSPDGNNILRTRTAAGALAVITGVSTTQPGYYAGPPEWWGIGACVGFKLQSVNADGTGNIVPQTGGPINLVVIFKS